MFELIDPILLARIQFAFTIGFHIIFPAFTIGLASFLAVLEGLWLKTKNTVFYDIYIFWIKIFAVTFGMGVVSGVVMSYQFGTNWSVFSDKTANILGPLLGFEVLTAFFLESSFLGIMLFGWGRVSKGMHFAATCIVAAGTLISAFWILSANSWMQTPQGFETMPDGRLIPTDWMAVIFNPSFPYRFFHMITAAYLTTAMVVGGVAAFYLFYKRHITQARTMFAMSVMMVALVSPLQLLIGHEHGKNTMLFQPAKVAAIEGNWEHTTHAPLYLFGWPSEQKQKVLFPLSIPGGASWVLTGDTNGAIPNLQEFPPEHRPPVATVFWSFRVMVGLGMLMIGLGAFSVLQYLRKRIFECTYLQALWMMMTPSGFIALLAGWFVTEIGRQPYVVYGILLTAKSASPAVIAPQIAWSLLAFILMYICVFGAGIYYILKLIAKGFYTTHKHEEQYYAHGLEASAIESFKNQKV
jgi:cytochrome d ubiquinol oxidase subunit I